MESVTIRGPSPIKIGRWKMWTGFQQDHKMTHLDSNIVLTGEPAKWMFKYLKQVGHTIDILDRRQWVWNHYLMSPMRWVGSTPDPRPYPYPESARRTA